MPTAPLFASPRFAATRLRSPVTAAGTRGNGRLPPQIWQNRASWHEAAGSLLEEVSLQPRKKGSNQGGMFCSACPDVGGSTLFEVVFPQPRKEGSNQGRTPCVTQTVPGARIPQEVSLPETAWCDIGLGLTLFRALLRVLGSHKSKT